VGIKAPSLVSTHVPRPIPSGIWVDAPTGNRPFQKHLPAAGNTPPLGNRAGRTRATCPPARGADRSKLKATSNPRAPTIANANTDLPAVCRFGAKGTRTPILTTKESPNRTRRSSPGFADRAAHPAKRGLQARILFRKNACSASTPSRFMETPFATALQQRPARSVRVISQALIQDEARKKSKISAA